LLFDFEYRGDIFLPDVEAAVRPYPSYSQPVESMICSKELVFFLGLFNDVF
jgi:hypothetical protein